MGSRPSPPLPADPLAVADAATAAMRRARAAQLDRVHDAVQSGRWHVHGFRSPHAWLTSTSADAPGACSLTLQLADRIQHMPAVKDHFGRSELSESALRLQIVATIALADLANATNGGVLDTNTGPITLSADAIRRLACDAGVHRLVTGPGSTILDYGRQSRTVSDAQFDVLTIRDHGCRIMGCQVPPDGCDAGHFVVRDSDGVVRPLHPPLVGLALPQPPLAVTGS